MAFVWAGCMVGEGLCATRVAADGLFGLGRCAQLQVRVLACRNCCAAASVSSACISTVPFAIVLCIISRLREIV